MKISIITVSFNSDAFIKSAIESVLRQTFRDFEYIIIDGGSCDRTVEIVKSYGNLITKFISESDLGIYDAMNKGLKMAEGDVIGFLNSDDLYVDENIIESVLNHFRTCGADSIYGDILYVHSDDTDKWVRYWKSDMFYPDSFKKGWHPPHPAFFVKRLIYQKYGYFNLEYKLAADFELMLRFLEKNKISTSYMAKPLVKMRMGGATNKSLRNIFRQNLECYNAFNANGLDVSWLYPFYRLAPKIMQYFYGSRS